MRTPDKATKQQATEHILGLNKASVNPEVVQLLVTLRNTNTVPSKLKLEAARGAPNTETQEHQVIEGALAL